jgi:hypothetical protein
MTDVSNVWRGAVFRKSSYSGQNAQCVEVARTGTMLGLRDSKNPVGPVLAVPGPRGQVFVAAAARGKLTRA